MDPTDMNTQEHLTIKPTRAIYGCVHARGDACPNPTAREIDIMDRALAVTLGLGSLLNRSICHGYANCCDCGSCRQLERNVSKRFRGWLENEDETAPMPRLLKRASKKTRQPWELAA